MERKAHLRQTDRFLNLRQTRVMHYKMESKFNLDLLMKNASSIWVFGYGSLVWRPGFEFHSKHIGYIEGFARRFWQGNATHRGTPSAPGRVATLVHEENSKVWGVAFELKGDRQIQEGFEHLGVRECALGGYDTKVVPFVTRRVIDEQGNKLVVPALVFMAVPENVQYLGEASIPELRDQIINSKGASGHNVEYVTRLADYIKTYIPEEDDPHLFELDAAIRAKLKLLKISLRVLIGDGKENYEPEQMELRVPQRKRAFCGVDINQDIYIFNNNEDRSNRIVDNCNPNNRKGSDSWESQDLPEMHPKEVNQIATMKRQS